MAVGIDVSNLAHAFSHAGADLPVLDDVTLTIAPGEMSCFLGPSGCGKSTLLNVIGGLLTPRSGQVRIGGTPVAGVMPQRVGYLFQESALFPWNTVWQNLMVGLEFQGVAPDQRAERATRALQAVGMSDFARFYPDQLSGGMKQRVSLARALALETEVLLMDEPFAALDEQTRMILGEDLSALLAQTGKTIVLVTHSLSEAVFLSDRIFVMTARPGRIKAVVEVRQEHPRRPEFMTSPAFNEARTHIYTLLYDEMRAAAATTPP
jgi:NitT/TauT family transport system ATP-binding protein